MPARPDPPPAPTPNPAPAGAPPTGPPAVTSTELLAGGRELVIRHGPDRYRLLLTAQNKLILTK